MSLDKPPKNKMMTAPPMKKGYHFASDGIFAAEFIEAETIQEAETIYLQVRRLLIPVVGGTGQSAGNGEKSTGTPAPEEEQGVQ